MINNWLFVCLTQEIKGLYSLMIFAKHIIVHKIVKFNAIAYGILRLSQLRGGGGGGRFYPTPQKTMLKLFDWFEIWYT